MARTPIREFELANRLYANCQVSFYTVAGGVATGTLAPLWDSATGGSPLANPQQLDGNGKFKQPVYIDVQVIGQVAGLSVPSHATGVISPAPTFRVDPTTSKLQYSYDGGVTWSDSGQTLFKYRGAWAGPGTVYNVTDEVSQAGVIYVCTTPNTSTASFAADLASGYWVQLFSATASAIANVPHNGIVETDVQGALNGLEDRKANLASPTFTGDPKAPTPAAGDNDTSIATTAFVQAAIVALALGASQSLVELMHINAQTGHRDLIQNGYVPVFFNQQWGGAPHYFELVDCVTGTPYKIEASTGNTQRNGTFAVADIAARTYVATGFKVSKSDNYPAVWSVLYKTGNPTNNLQCFIYSDDGTGKPSALITNGTATAISGLRFSSDSAGQWVRFSFATPPALVAGTQYHVVFKSSGVVDPTNYWAPITDGSRKYPHGYMNQGDGTPTWTSTTGTALPFLIEAPSTTASLQAGGLFNDGKLAFFEGAPLNQSNGRTKELKDFRQLDMTDFTALIEGANWTKGKPIAEFMYGMDHDRISIQCNAGTGFPSVNVYKTDGSLVTVTGTVDASAAGNQFIGIRIRAKNDGADTVDLWQGSGASMTKVATSGAISIAFDTLFGLAKIGTFWIGGGFALAPTWTQKLNMNVLPSADTPAWAWTGTAIEGNAMTVSGGKLYQAKVGYAATDTGYYKKTAAGFSNATGGAVIGKYRVSNSPNVKNSGDAALSLEDGTRYSQWDAEEYFGNTYSNGWLTPFPQADFKSAENVHLNVMKGVDGYIFVNGRLVQDNTGLMGASANNQVFFGDSDATSGSNADVVYDYVAYYNTAWLAPQFSSGSLSELAMWSGDRTGIFATLWNAGSPFSVKAVCGVQKNFVGDPWVQRIQQQGITSSPTTTSNLYPAATTIAEMECFGIGSFAAWHGPRAWLSNSTAGSAQSYVSPVVDGVSADRDGSVVSTYLANFSGTFNADHDALLPFGLHKFEFRMGTGGGTLTANAQRRAAYLEIRA